MLVKLLLLAGLVAAAHGGRMVRNPQNGNFEITRIFKTPGERLDDESSARTQRLRSFMTCGRNHNCDSEEAHESCTDVLTIQAERLGSELAEMDAPAKICKDIGPEMEKRLPGAWKLVKVVCPNVLANLEKDPSQAVKTICQLVRKDKALGQDSDEEDLQLAPRTSVDYIARPESEFVESQATDCEHDDELLQAGWGTGSPPPCPPSHR